MKKHLLWIGTALLMTLMPGCRREAEKTPQFEEKITQKDPSALRYQMFKVEDATVTDVARAFKDYLEEEGMFYPRFVDFHRAATVDNIEFEMNPTVLALFGHPKEMGLLIRENPEAAYDLPFRILIFRNNEGEVWVMYKDFDSFKAQYFLADQMNILPKYDKLLQGFKKRLPHYLNFYRQAPE
ncbi:MAG: DUF302 domain-containing protein [Chlorobi bacterium]|nr:DUF302 domain-containing protein [Chlorobiota bacterium]